MNVNSFDPRLKSPFTCIINGSSKSGKTFLIDHILKNQKQTTTEEKYEQIVIWYQNYQEIYSNWAKLAPTVLFHKGFPVEAEGYMLEMFGLQTSSILIIDDLDVLEKDVSSIIARYFTVYSHHRNVSIILATHHLFMQAKQSVLLSRNADYMILLPSPRDKSAVRTLGYQCKPQNSMFLLSAFEMATEKEHGYLLCDWTSGTSEEYRYRETFTTTKPIICYREEEKEASSRRDKKDATEHTK